MKIAIGNDHTSVDLKFEIVNLLLEKGIETRDFGYTPGKGECADYPVYAELVSDAVIGGECSAGIVLCGTGIGVSISANKIRGIRAAACSEPFSARMAKEHNNANVLCIGSRVVGAELAKMIVNEWLEAEFQGADNPRHQRRIDLITEIEHRDDRPGRPFTKE